VNDRPEFTSTPLTVIEEGDEYKYEVEVTDVDGDSVDVSLEHGPWNMSLTGQILTWVPGPADVGNHTVSLMAKDEVSENHQNFTIVVVNVNNGPTIPTLPSQEAQVGHEFIYKVSAEDPDIGVNPVEVLTFSDDSDLFDIDPDTGTITFTPTWTQIGTYNVNIKVVDWKGVEAKATLEIDVVFPPGTTMPKVNITSPENGTKVKTKKDIDFSAKVTYGGGGDWNLTWTVDGEHVAYGEDVTINFPTKGEHTIKVVASDGNGTVEDSIVVIARKPKSDDKLPGFDALLLVVAIVIAVGLVISSRKRDE
jgi:hypothetical protein